MNKIILVCFLLFGFAGCADKDENGENYTFSVNGLNIAMGDAVGDFLSKTGAPANKYSAPSCAFDGDDTVYDFSTYQITTYVSDGKEIFTGVYLLDSRYSTKEGIKIGSSLQKMLDVYGDDYKESYGAYTYSKGLTDLSFVVIDGVITSISYLHKVE